ncbi:hypothetical protein [Desulfurobacterium indicum]|uniref:Uncharacterized protein n=1 Tax=Desulfurobacterium indicum TaxID=1914305 RepID=A0A1R1MJY4_9BACT|nr:hypothetical protein [Desulfurobacterium indicum]OMH40125.1 hypothetical protein BLW93_06875 [Desulfurobacterium indicum]
MNEQELLIKQIEKAKEEGDKMVSEILSGIKRILELLPEISDEKNEKCERVRNLLQEITTVTSYQDIISQRLEKVKKVLAGDENITIEDLDWNLEESKRVAQDDIDNFFN